jgi:hypothetical protein
MKSMTNKFALVALFCMCVSIFACTTKTNPIDNSATIKVPYTMYGGTRAGKILKTNDAINYDRLHQGSGLFTNAIFTVDTNLLWINTQIKLGCATKPTEKFSFQVVTSFAPSIRNSIAPFDQGYPNAACYDPTNKKIYVAMLSGVYENSKSGAINNWGPSTFGVTSPFIRGVIRTADGNIFAFDDNYRIHKSNGSGVVSTFSIVPLATTAANRPQTASGQDYFLSNANNRLILSDLKGISGALFSDDGGINWSKFSNVPAKGRFLMGKQVAYDGGYYTSIDSMGLYKMVGNSLQAQNGSLPANSRIWDITAKRNVYRTDVAKYYYYVGTDKGLYRSNDGLKNWEYAYFEEFTALY